MQSKIKAGVKAGSQLGMAAQYAADEAIAATEGSGVASREKGWRQDFYDPGSTSAHLLPAPPVRWITRSIIRPQKYFVVVMVLR